jgi:hypothetical protein
VFFDSNLMPITSVGAIYATNSKLLQRIYVPHGDDSEIAQQFVAAGETLVSVPLAIYQSGGVLAVQSAIGTPTFSGRCVVVNNANSVIDAILADPAIYSDPRGQVIPSDFAMVNDHWTGTTFTRVLAQVSLTTGNIVSIGPQAISNATAASGNILMVVGPSALLGQNVIGTAKLAGLATATAVVG